MSRALTPIFVKSDKLQRCQPQSLNFRLHISGAKANVAEATLSLPLLTGYDSTDLTQAIVEQFLGHTSAIVCATAFGSTAMGTDVIGFVLDMQGGAGSIVSIEVNESLSANGAVLGQLVDGSQSALTNSLASAVAVSSDGDIYGRILCTGLDAATAGYLDITIFYRSK
jgi:hypothetical protein